MSDTNLKIYHNPRCSKSRATLQLLEEKQLQPEIIKYLDTPPTAEELRHILSLLNMSARELLRTGEAEYKQNKLDDPSLTEEQIIEIMVANPKLIERPIVVYNGKAAIGRPLENVMAIL